MCECATSVSRCKAWQRGVALPCPTILALTGPCQLLVVPVCKHGDELGPTAVQGAWCSIPPYVHRPSLEGTAEPAARQTDTASYGTSKNSKYC